MWLVGVVSLAMMIWFNGCPLKEFWGAQARDPPIIEMEDIAPEKQMRIF